MWLQDRHTQHMTENTIYSKHNTEVMDPYRKCHILKKEVTLCFQQQTEYVFCIVPDDQERREKLTIMKVLPKISYKANYMSV